MNYSWRHVKIVSSGMLAREALHCTKFLELLNIPFQHHLPHSIDAWIIISPGLEAHLKQRDILFVSPGDTLAYLHVAVAWNTICMDCHFEVVFAQQFVATERRPIATSGPPSK
jgi:hypothetical protein